jgi:arylsulfatase A-like enzyme
MSRGRSVAWLLGLVACLAVSLFPASAGAAQRPNILVIVTDDQREGLGVMPFTREWFGRGGTKYPHAFANTPVCCPARASIMTGLYAHNHGVLTNTDQANLNHDATLQAALHGAGYTTAIVGKFLNKWDLGQAPPNFDRWSVWSNALDGAPFANRTYYGGVWNVNGDLQEVDPYSTRFVSKSAVDFLEQEESRDERPWFLYVAPFAPHLPALPEASYAEASVPPWPGNPASFESDLSDKPPWWQTRRFSLSDGRKVRKKQLRTLMSVDDLVERIANRLTALGENRRTLAVFTSDNGFAWSEHGLKGKGSPYTPSVRVPLYLRWPGRVPEGAKDGRLVAHVDITPTIRAVANLPSAAPLDGHSLLDLSWKRERLLVEFFVAPDATARLWASTLTKRTQYTEYYAPDTGAVVFRELYDLRADPWQLENLYEDPDPANDPSAERTAAMSDTLAQDRACAGTTCP